jgi:hypothetical protein
MKTYLIAAVFAIFIALDVVLYTKAGEAAKHDIRLIAFLGVLAMSAFAALYGASWLLYKTHPDNVPIGVTVLGLVIALLALLWTLAVAYVWIRVILNSFT